MKKKIIIIKKIMGFHGKYQQYIRMAFIRNNEEEEEHVNRRKKNRWESGCCS